MAVEATETRGDIAQARASTCTAAVLTTAGGESDDLLLNTKWCGFYE